MIFLQQDFAEDAMIGQSFTIRFGPMSERQLKLGQERKEKEKGKIKDKIIKCLQSRDGS